LKTFSLRTRLTIAAILVATLAALLATVLSFSMMRQHLAGAIAAPLPSPSSSSNADTAAKGQVDVAAVRSASLDIAIVELGQTQIRALGWAACIVILLIPFAWLYIRTQLTPLSQLQQRIADSKNQPTPALPTQKYTQDEIGELALSFDNVLRERLYAEARYQSGAEELLAATNSGLDAFFIFQAERDASGQILDFTIRYLNNNAEKLIGGHFASVAHQSLREVIPDHWLTARSKRFVELMRAGQPIQEELAVEVSDDSVDPAVASNMHVRWYLHQMVPQADGFTLSLRDVTERKQEEIKNRSDRAFLQSLTDHLPLLFYAKKIDEEGNGRFISWNAMAEEISGFNADAVIGKTDRELFSGKLATVYEEHDEMIVTTRSRIDTPETRFHRPDGSVRYLRVISVPIFDEKGSVDIIIGIGEDITDKRQHDRIVRASRAELLAVNDSSPLGLFMTDLAGNCTYVNKTYELMAGVTATSLVGDTWFRSLHPADQDAAIETWVRSIRQDEPYQSVHRFPRSDGRVLWGSFKAVPMIIDDQVTGYVGSVDDITARLEAEQAMRAIQDRLRLVADNIPALISYVTPDRRFEFANRKYQDAFGTALADISGMALHEVLGADVYAQSEPFVEQALAGQAAHFERLVTHIGQLRWERVSYVPNVDANGDTTGFFSLAEDITELKQAQHTFARSEMRLRMITDNLPALIAYIDHDQRYRFCNGYYETVLGLKPEKILGLTLKELGGPIPYTLMAPRITQVMAGERVNFEEDGLTAGVNRHFACDYIPDVGTDGSVIGFYSMVLDITARKEAELKQAAGEQLLRALTDNLPALVGFIDRDERFRFNNRVYAEWLGKPLSEITGRSMRDVYGDETYRRYKPYFDHALAGHKADFEFEALRDEKMHFFQAAYAPQFNDDGSTSGVCSMISDITALKEVENQLRVLARFDSLTGLPNRNQFEEKLTEAIARSARSKRLMAVMFLDIDHFKKINDTVGHHGGDAVLREFAQRLQRCVRKTDCVSRLAGDEFTIILEGLQAEEEAAVVADKILNAMRDDFKVDDDTYRNVTTSIGIAVRRPDETSPEALLRRADEALYAAKSAGRNTFERLT
jgi:diguanylate cyclase (GGDEF)-like protein/PAS domain S-box-containing protein